MKTLCVLLCLALRLSGQEGTVDLRVIVFPRAQDDQKISLVVGKKLVEIEVAANRLTGPYKVERQANWTFGHPAVDEAGKPAFKTLGSTAALAAPAQILILFRKGRTNDDGFKVVAYSGGPREFGGRQFLLLNLTRDRVGGDIGQVKFALKPAGHTVISPKSDAGENLCHATILLNRNERWTPFVSTNWPLRDDARGLVFIYQDPATGKIQLHAIRDFL